MNKKKLQCIFSLQHTLIDRYYVPYYSGHFESMTYIVRRVHKLLALFSLLQGFPNTDTQDILFILIIIN